MKQVNYSDMQMAVKEVNDALTVYSNELFKDDHWKSYAEVEVSTWGNEPIEAKVNWCAIGSVAPEQAEAMAKLLTRAAEAARNFKYNGYEVTF